MGTLREPKDEEMIVCEKCSEELKLDYKVYYPRAVLSERKGGTPWNRTGPGDLYCPRGHPLKVPAVAG